MIYRILRYVIAILVGTAAYVGMDSLAPIIDPYLVSQFESFGDMSLTIARISVLILGTLIGVIIGYLISSFILKQGLVIAKTIRTYSHSYSKSRIDCGRHHRFIIRSYYCKFNWCCIQSSTYHGTLYSYYIECYSLDIVAFRLWLVKALKCTITMYNNGGGEGTKKQVVLKRSLLINLIKLLVTPKLLDTSVIIDGRIKELCNTGFY